ncbi:hypothetical protein ACFUMH_13740 [Cellulomonas sp. NPDC057328]|uniref:hypothetical protein n=1 Tax=Cellulomonas sp. NPDC057328 TaxID=3346101 RepID=UPI00362F9DDB
MSAQLEVPHLDDLRDLDVTIEPSEELGVVSVTAWADDGSRVTLTWDEIAGSTSIRWSDGGQERLVLERETASKVSVRKDGGGVRLHVWSTYQELSGELVVRVGTSVSVRDVLLLT